MEKTIIPFSISESIEVKDNGQAFGKVTGIGSTFGDIDLGGDRIIKGAFVDSLKKSKKENRKIKMMAGHREVIGGWSEYKETDQGLLVSGFINLDVQKGRETYSLAKQEVITDLSIGYIATDYAYVKEKSGTIREIKKLDLYEVSLVAFPMNTNANILDIKSCNTIGDISKFLKSYGISQKDTNEIVYHLKSFTRNESDDQIEETEKFDEKHRNDVLESMDRIITSFKMNEVINRSKRHG